MYLDRKQAAALGRETLEIVRRGRYDGPAGGVDLQPSIDRAIAETADYRFDSSIPDVDRPSDQVATQFWVANETSLARARALAEAGQRPMVLNFASAKNPGGGFLSGARAQEESLACRSALIACLEGRPMYEFHRQRRDPLYTSWAMYSPDVPVFRDDAGSLLPAPYACSFITAPAPNAKVVLQRAPERAGEVASAMRERVDRVLAIAAAHGERDLVLGAWGCGVFGNNTRDVAEMFADALSGRFAAVFHSVSFAVLDSSQSRKFIGPFEERFGAAA